MEFLQQSPMDRLGRNLDDLRKLVFGLSTFALRHNAPIWKSSRK